MLSVKPLSTDFSVAAQIAVSDIASIKAQGFATLVNNRPDFEHGPEQASDEQLRAAAQQAGLHYVFLPVTPGQFTAQQIATMAQVIEISPKPILAFCRSGSRSANLYQSAMGQ
jgi:uncharacterized protein (TIGR01244 family)